uniref:Uncharacterized protein n=1 Tax=Oryza glumipatula TaxID=40148 RepID=A0A0D9YKG0_9ORYZ
MMLGLISGDAVLSVLSIAGSVAIVYLMYRCVKKNGLPAIRNATIERFLKEIAGEKPIRFTAQHIWVLSSDVVLQALLVGEIFSGSI